LSAARPAANVALLVASVLFALLLLEGGIRLLEVAPRKSPPAVAPPDSAAASVTPEYLPSDSLGWVLRPAAVQSFRRPGFDTTVRSNRFGFRGPEIALKEPGVIRYAVLGDSYAFGWGVEEEETYPAQLDSLLNRRATPGKRYQVVNAALPGFGTYQRIAALERLVPYGLDGIIVEFSVSNDVVDDWRAAPYVPENMGAYQAGIQTGGIERFFVDRSRLAAMVLNRARPLRFWLEARSGGNLRRTARLWEGLLDRAAALGLPVVVVVNPSRTQLLGEGDLMSRLAHTQFGLRPNTMIHDIIRRRSLRWVDGQDVFGTIPAGQLFLGQDVHWTPAGHQELAAALARIIGTTPPGAVAGP
jgi:hypothetical protein